VQDRDLWQFKLPDSHKIHAWISLFPRTFMAWDEMDAVLTQNFDLAVDHGGVAEQSDKMIVSDLLKYGTRCCVHIVGYAVPVVNAPKRFVSDVGNALLAMFPDAKFAAVYSDRGDGRREWGLRGRGDFDVSEIALKYGGGGHKNAAGFTTSYDDDLDLKKRGGGGMFGGLR
jgi:oligoribonuclease NrnB/cAMP/cGMP phosphodiesterase (DHH superfamily)